MELRRPSLPRPEPMVAPPAHAWPACALDMLPARLVPGGWTLVEFWAPDVLSGRLMEPIRVRLPGSHGGRLRLLFCAVTLGGECCAFGVTALPALVLFHGAQRVWRWFGALDASLLAHGLDAVLADAAR